MKPSRRALFWGIITGTLCMAPFLAQLSSNTPPFVVAIALVFWVAIMVRFTGAFLKWGSMVSFLDRDRTKS